MEIEKVVENVESVAKTNKVDKKGLVVILGAATCLGTVALFIIKKVREKKTAKSESNEVESENMVTNAKA